MWIAYAQWSILELFGYRLLTHRIRIVSYTLSQPAPITNCMEHALFFIFSCFSRQFIHNNVAIEIVQCIRCYCALWSQAHGKFDKSVAVCAWHFFRSCNAVARVLCIDQTWFSSFCLALALCYIKHFRLFFTPSHLSTLIAVVRHFYRLQLWFFFCLFVCVCFFIIIRQAHNIQSFAYNVI